MINRQILLAARPKGFPTKNDFCLRESPVPDPGDGEFIVRGEYLSVDPYMRGRMSDAASYAPPRGDWGGHGRGKRGAHRPFTQRCVSRRSLCCWHVRLAGIWL